MSFEDLDQQINDAADKHHPEYHEEAWGKMEDLLNKHLPQSKPRRRRALLLLPLLLLIGAGSYFVVSSLIRGSGEQGTGNGEQVLSEKAKPLSKGEQVVRDEGTESGEKVLSDKAKALSNEEQVLSDKAKPLSEGTGNRDQGMGTAMPIAGNQQLATSNLKLETGNQQPETSNRQPATRNQQPVTSNWQLATSNQQLATGNLQRSRNKVPVSKQLKPIVPKEEAKENTTGGIVNISDQLPQPEESIVPPVFTEETLVPLKAEETKPPAAIINDKKDQPATPAKKETAKKIIKRNGFGNAFAITFSAGMDMSAVRFSEPGRKRIITGAGLQYQLNKYFTVRAGIFQTNKVYGAQPQDYHSDYVAPAGSMLTGVDGDCRVFEIPVSIAYTFNPGKKLIFFAAAGASSMIMKKEDYVYNYKTNYGLVYTSDYGVKNVNQHLFASIDLSAGVERQFSKRLFLRAEPYLRLPIKGVGLGDVKLKSAGILLTAGIKPFAKNR